MAQQMHEGELLYHIWVAYLQRLLRTIAAIISGHILFRFLQQVKNITLVCGLVILYYLLVGNLQGFAERTQQMLLLLFTLSLIAHFTALLYLLILLLVHRVRIRKKRARLFRHRFISWVIETLVTLLVIVGMVIFEVVGSGG